MILPRALVVPLAMLVAVLTLTITFEAGIAKAPREFLGAGDTVVLAPADGSLPGQGTVPLALAGPLAGLPGTQHVSPEIYPLLSLDGRSAFVRGVDPASFLSLDGGRMVEGDAPTSEGEMIVGVGAARAFGLDAGSIVTLPSALGRSAVALRVSGIFDSPSPARDELVVPLATAQLLADLRPTDVHLIRIASEQPGNLSRLLSGEPNFTFSDVALSTRDVLQGEPITLTANVTNWGISPATKVFTVYDRGRTILQDSVHVPARATVGISVEFVLEDAGLANVSINPSFDVVVRESRYQITDLPLTFTVGSPVSVTVVDPKGEPVADVLVGLQRAQGRTGADGRVTLTPTDEGMAKVVAYDGSATGAIATRYAALPEHADAPVARVDRILPPDQPIGVNDSAVFSVQLRNRGGVAGEVGADVLVDGVVASRVALTLPPGEARLVPVELPPMPAGPHVVTTDPSGPSVEVRSYAGRDPRVTRLIEAMRERPELDSSPVTPTDVSGYIDELVGKVRLGVLAMALASATLVVLGAISVVSRHIKERAPVLGTLKAIGADDEHIMRKASTEAVLLGAIASALGVLLGVALGAAIDATSWVRAFGHVVHPSWAWSLLATILVVAPAAFVLLVRALVAAALRQPIDDLLASRLLRPVPRAPPALHHLLEEPT